MVIMTCEALQCVLTLAHCSLGVDVAYSVKFGSKVIQLLSSLPLQLLFPAG